MKTSVCGSAEPVLEGGAFLRNLDLNTATDEEVKRGVLEVVPAGAKYRMSIVNTTMGTPSQPVLGKEITLSWHVVAEVFYNVSKFFKGFFCSLREGDFSRCSSLCISRVFTELGPDGLEKATGEQLAEGREEIGKAYEQGLRIIIKVSNDKRLFELFLRDEMILKKSFERGYSLGKFLSLPRSRRKCGFFDCHIVTQDLLRCARDLLILQAPPLRVLSDFQHEVRNKQRKSLVTDLRAFVTDFYKVYGEFGFSGNFENVLATQFFVEEPDTVTAKGTILLLQALRDTLVSFLSEQTSIRDKGVPEEERDKKAKMYPGNSYLEKIEVHLEQLNRIISSFERRVTWGTLFNRYDEARNVVPKAKAFFDLRSLSIDGMNINGIGEWTNALKDLKRIFSECVRELLHNLGKEAHLQQLEDLLKKREDDLEEMVKKIKLVRSSLVELLQTYRKMGNEDGLEEKEKSRRAGLLDQVGGVEQEMRAFIADYYLQQNRARAATPPKEKVEFTEAVYEAAIKEARDLFRSEEQAVADSEAARAQVAAIVEGVLTAAVSEAARAAAIREAEAVLAKEAREAEMAQDAFVMLEPKTGPVQAKPTGGGSGKGGWGRRWFRR